jgi:hypothetical protein
MLYLNIRKTKTFIEYPSFYSIPVLRLLNGILKALVLWRYKEMNMNDNLLGQVYKAFESVGIKLLSDDFCCQLLAWLNVYGDGVENIVLDVKLRTDILEAQRRLNLFGGEIPNVDLLPKLQEYIKSISDFKKPPEWVKELEKKYGLKFKNR